MSFKVICVDAGAIQLSCGGTLTPMAKLCEGKEYEVVVEAKEFWTGLPGYILKDFPRNGYGLLKQRFAPSSTIDEKELIKEREMINEKV